MKHQKQAKKILGKNEKVRLVVLGLLFLLILVRTAELVISQYAGGKEEIALSPFFSSGITFIYGLLVIAIITIVIKWNLITIRKTLMLFAVTLALSASLFFQVKRLVPQNYHNWITFYVPNELSDAWKPRLFSYYLANQFVTRQEGPPDEVNPGHIAQWVAIWFFLTNALFIISKNRSSLIYMYLFGMYATVSFGYMPGIVQRVYPWDMPALFFYTLAVILIDQKKFAYLIPLLPIAMGFKETAIVLTLALLFWDTIPFKRRGILFGLTVLLCVGIKSSIDVVTHNQQIFLTMTYEYDLPWIIENLKWCLAEWRTAKSPLFINGGTLVAFLLLPLVNRKMVLFKLISGIFILANLMLGAIWEYRIWFEMIPLALVGFEMYIMSLKAQEMTLHDPSQQ